MLHVVKTELVIINKQSHGMVVVIHKTHIIDFGFRQNKKMLVGNTTGILL